MVPVYATANDPSLLILSRQSERRNQMNRLLLASVLLFVLESDGCNDTKTAVGTVGAVQDSVVTGKKRAADKERNPYQEDVAPMPTPVEMREIHDASLPAAEYIEQSSKEANK